MLLLPVILVCVRLTVSANIVMHIFSVSEDDDTKVAMTGYCYKHAIYCE